jgi:hypothetical protein
MLLSLLAMTVSARAQTTLSSTTLAAALGDTSSTNITLTATTGFTATTTAQQTYVLIDREILTLRTVNTTTKVAAVSRGQQASRAASHISGATVWFAPQGAFFTYIPSGQCTRTTLAYVPTIVGGLIGLAGSDVGGLWDCLGVGTSGQWTQTAPSVGVQTIGSVVASATSITPTGTYFQVSGTTAVNTIVVPAGWLSGNCLALEPTGVFTTGTSGNINVASTAVVGKILYECWNGVSGKWNGSY